jgi:hypothetical protein
VIAVLDTVYNNLEVLKAIKVERDWVGYMRGSSSVGGSSGTAKKWGNWRKQLIWICCSLLHISTIKVALVN